MATPALLMSSGLGSWSPGCVHPQHHSLPLGSFCPSSEPLLRSPGFLAKGRGGPWRWWTNRLGAALVGFLKSASPPLRILRIETLASTKTLPASSLMGVQAACLWAARTVCCSHVWKLFRLALPFSSSLTWAEEIWNPGPVLSPCPSHPQSCAVYPSLLLKQQACSTGAQVGTVMFTKQLLIQEGLGGHIYMKTIIWAELLLQKLGTFRPGVQGRGRGPGAGMCVC